MLSLNQAKPGVASDIVQMCLTEECLVKVFKYDPLLLPPCCCCSSMTDRSDQRVELRADRSSTIQAQVERKRNRSACAPYYCLRPPCHHAPPMCDICGRCRHAHSNCKTSPRDHILDLARAVVCWCRLQFKDATLARRYEHGISCMWSWVCRLCLAWDGADPAAVGAGTAMAFAVKIINA